MVQKLIPHQQIGCGGMYVRSGLIQWTYSGLGTYSGLRTENHQRRYGSLTGAAGRQITRAVRRRWLSLLRVRNGADRSSCWSALHRRAVGHLKAADGGLTAQRTHHVILISTCLLELKRVIARRFCTVDTTPKRLPGNERLEQLSTDVSAASKQLSSKRMYLTTLS